MTEITSQNVPLYIRAAGTSTWKALVCLENYTMPLAVANNTVNTFCGPKTSVGVVTLSPAGTAVAEVDLSPDLISHKEMIDFLLNKTLLEFKAENPTGGSVYGSNFFLYGKGYLTSMTNTFATDNNVTFDFTITGTDTPSNVPFD